MVAPHSEAMNIFPITAPFTSVSKEIKHTFYDLPVESLAFAIAGFAAMIFKFSFAASLAGISFGMVAANLATKILRLYHPILVIDITKELCKLVRRYPKLQFISFIITLVVGSLFQKVGFFVGSIVGGFNAIILDVEKYKHLRQAMIL